MLIHACQTMFFERGRTFTLLDKRYLSNYLHNIVILFLNLLVKERNFLCKRVSCRNSARNCPSNSSITSVTVKINPSLSLKQRSHKVLHAFFVIRNLPQGLVLKVPYFWASFEAIVVPKVP